MTDTDKQPSANNVRFMDALPDHADIAAQLIHDTGYEIFDYSYISASKFKRFATTNWPKPQGFFSFANTKAAYFNDALVGIELSFDTKSRLAMIEPHTALEKSMFSAADQKLIDERWPRISYIMPEIADTALYLSNLAVHQDARGRGIGEALLSRCFQRAKADGYETVMLDVSSEKPAVQLYLRMGMKPVAETRLPYLNEHHNVPMHIRMVKDLKEI